MNHENHTFWMQKAIACAQEGSTPFGALVLNQQGDFVSSFNSTKQDGPTAHAEMNVLQKLKQLDYQSKNELVLYTTVEPCPMCMGGILWAGIGKIVYGASIKEVSKIIKQIMVDSHTLANKSWYQPEIIGGVLKEDCLALFEGWP